jgi:hypothetical protein
MKSPQPKLQKHPFIQSCTPFSSQEEHQASRDQQQQWMTKHIEVACCTLEWLHFLLYCVGQVPGVDYIHQRLLFTIRSLSSSSKGVFDMISQTVKPQNPNNRKSNLSGVSELGRNYRHHHHHPKKL